MVIVKFTAEVLVGFIPVITAIKEDYILPWVGIKKLLLVKAYGYVCPLKTRSNSFRITYLSDPLINTNTT